MSTIAPSTGSKSPLDAAQKIVSELHGMPPEDQILALRFATETLHLQIPAQLPLNYSPTPAALPSTAGLSLPNSVGHSTDIKRFTELKAPKSDQQFAAVVAYFYQFEAPPDQRKDAIDVDTMKNAARLAGRVHPPNWIYTLNNAKNAGYLDSTGSGSFKLSSVGENLVAITLPSNAVAPATKRPKTSATKAKRAKTVKKA